MVTDLAEQSKFLPGLTVALQSLKSQGDNISTLDFTSLCDRILVVFDYLGVILSFAKSEMMTKNNSLKVVANRLTTLDQVVAADKAAGKLTTKNSCARNLHRLMYTIMFIRLVFSHLLADPKMTLKDAMYSAYKASLAQIHTYMVQTAVWAGLYALPTREAFMKSIGETEESARGAAAEFIKGTESLIEAIKQLYDVEMPASDVTMIPAC